MTRPLLEFEGLSKGFGGVPVLRAVSFTVAAGKTVGLVGENGAGKSTLMNLLGGNLRPDAGRMWWEGQEFEPANPAAATRAGIAFIHQELNLFPNLSIAENLFLTSFPRRARVAIDRARLRHQTAELLAQVGLAAVPDTRVERLSPGERQLVEVARALSLDARLIILDEPTTSLGARETERLFALLGRLRARGIALIYISHTLADVRRLADEVVVLRDGEVVGAGPVGEFPAERLVSLMVGRKLSQLFPERQGARAGSAAPVLEVRGLSQPGGVRDIAFTLQRGEVLGVAGLMGAGRSELARVLFGLDPHRAGEVRLEGRLLPRCRPRQCIEAGLAFLTEDRRAEGLCLEAAIADNIALVSLRRHAGRGWGRLRLPAVAGAVRSIRAAVRLTPAARDDQPVQTLSGGNQQKVVLAKWLLAAPKVLILDEPTRGIDVGAKFEIYQLILHLADRGAGVLLISSELEELIGLCDRILVMRQGELVEEVERGQFDRERLLRAALPT